jgi:hypothetical protein
MSKPALDLSETPSEVSRPLSVRSVFWWSVCLNALVLVPIILADRFISDDWGRAVRGYAAWLDQGRPLTEVLMLAVNLGLPMNDFSPLPQVGALLIYGVIALVIAKRFSFGSNVAPALITLVLFANPLTLRTIAQKFDALSIACSVCCALLPLSISQRRTRWSLLAGFVCLLACLCLYQPSLNVFLVFAVLEIVYEQQRQQSGGPIIKLGLIRAAQLVSALLVYQFVAKLTVSGEYAETTSQLVGLPSGLRTVIDNLKMWWRFPAKELPHSFRIIGEAIVWGGLISMLIVQFEYLRKQWNELGSAGRIAWCAVSLLLPICWILGSSGALILISHFSWIIPRVCAGIGATFASALILVWFRLERLRLTRVLRLVVLGLPAYMLIYFSAVYANAQKQQKIFEERIAARLSLTLQDLRRTHPFNSICIGGQAGLAPMVQAVERRFRLIRYLVEEDLGGVNSFTHEVLIAGGVPHQTANGRLESYVHQIQDKPTLVEDPYYRIYLMNGTLLLVFQHDDEASRSENLESE